MQLSRVKLDTGAQPVEVNGGTAVLQTNSRDTLTSTQEETEQSYFSCCCTDLCGLLSSWYDSIAGCIRSLIGWVLGADRVETTVLPLPPETTPMTATAQVAEPELEPVKVVHQNQPQIDQVTKFIHAWHAADRDTLDTPEKRGEWSNQFNALPEYPRALALKEFVDFGVKSSIYYELRKAQEETTPERLVQQALHESPAKRKVLQAAGQWTLDGSLSQELPVIYSQADFVEHFLIDWPGFTTYPEGDPNTRYFQRLWEKSFALLPEGAKQAVREAVSNALTLALTEVDQHIAKSIEDRVVLAALRDWQQTDAAKAPYGKKEEPRVDAPLEERKQEQQDQI